MRENARWREATKERLGEGEDDRAEKTMEM
jgi:hypothetical protein